MYKQKGEIDKKNAKVLHPTLKIIGVIKKGTARFLWKTLDCLRLGTVVFTSTLKIGNFEYSKYWTYV